MHALARVVANRDANSLAVALSLVGFLGAALLAFVLTYAVREHARRAGLFDRPEEHNGHGEQLLRAGIPRVGGVAIALAVTVTVNWMAALVPRVGLAVFSGPGRGLFVTLCGALAVHLVGLVDDVHPVRARWKLTAQALVALLVYQAGVRVTAVALPAFGVVQLAAPVGALLTVGWLVGATNAFNLIDGIDGLAPGVALFALVPIVAGAAAYHRLDVAVAGLILAGASLGFLWFNAYPASIFLGDSGSLFMGFMLAGVGLLSTQASPGVVTAAVPVVALGLPLLDTLLAVARRTWRGRSIFVADREHIHHRVLDRMAADGYSPRAAVRVLYGVCALFAVVGAALR